MYRSTIYSQEQGRSFDLLWFERDVITGLGALEAGMLGTTATVVTGLAASQTSPASLTLNIAAGYVYQNGAVDSSSWGSLGPDSDLIQQQGFAPAQVLTLSTTGLSAGQSRYALIQATFSQLDAVRPGDPTGGLLYYYNSANPSSPFQGQGGGGVIQNSVREGVCSVSILYGAVATSGSEVPPNPSAGNVGLYLIDLAFGQSAVVNANIIVAGPSVAANVPSNYPSAPIVAGLLNSHHAGGGGQAPQIKLTSEVQGILPLGNLPASSAPTGGGLSTVQTYPGNPNGHVAGVKAVAGASPPDLCWDVTNSVLYACIASGNAAAAVWQATSSPTLSANTTYYVNNVLGNDANDGKNPGAGAFFSLSHAIAVLRTINLSGFTVTIQLGLTGVEYVSPGNISNPSSGALNIIGDVANQAAYIITATAANNNQFGVSGGGSTINFSGLTIKNTSANFNTLNVTNSATVSLSRVTLVNTVSTVFACLAVTNNASVSIFAGCQFTVPSVSYMWIAEFSGTIIFSGAPGAIFTGTVLSGVANAAFGGIIALGTGGNTVSGSITGPRFSAIFNGAISVNGAGINYFPGTVAGSLSNGGQYG